MEAGSSKPVTQEQGVLSMTVGGGEETASGGGFLPWLTNELLYKFGWSAYTCAIYPIILRLWMSYLAYVRWWAGHHKDRLALAVLGPNVSLSWLFQIFFYYEMPVRKWSPGEEVSGAALLRRGRQECISWTCAISPQATCRRLGFLKHWPAC